MYTRINDKLKTDLAMKWALAKNKTKLARDYSLSYNTVVNVISGTTKEVRSSTYECLEALASGAPSHKEEKKAQEEKERLAALKAKMQESDKPKDESTINSAQDTNVQMFNKPSSEELKQAAKIPGVSQITPPNLQNDPNEIAELKQQVAMLKSTVHQLVIAYELDKTLTSQLMEQVNHATKWMNEDTQHSIDNFMKHNEKVAESLENLNTNFQTLMKRHEHLTHDNKDIKEDLKTIGIKLWPSNINKLKTTRVDK